MGLSASPRSPLHPRLFLSVFYQIPLFMPPFLLLKSPNSCKRPSWWFLLNPVVGQRGRGCRLSLGFPLKVVEEGGAIKVRRLEPPCFLFYFYDWAFFLLAQATAGGVNGCPRCLSLNKDPTSRAGASSPAMRPPL